MPSLLSAFRSTGTHLYTIPEPSHYLLEAPESPIFDIALLHIFFLQAYPNPMHQVKVLAAIYTRRESVTVVEYQWTLLHLPLGFVMKPSGTTDGRCLFLVSNRVELLVFVHPAVLVVLGHTFVSFDMAIASVVKDGGMAISLEHRIGLLLVVS